MTSNSLNIAIWLLYELGVYVSVCIDERQLFPPATFIKA